MHEMSIVGEQQSHFVSQNQRNTVAKENALPKVTDSIQSSIVIQDIEERKLGPVEEGFITDRLTEQSNEQKMGSYMGLEADDEHMTSNQMGQHGEPCSSQKHPSQSFSMKKEPTPESYPTQITVLLQDASDNESEHHSQ